MLYGQSLDPDNQSILTFPPHWGNDNMAVVHEWFSQENISDYVRIELQINTAHVENEEVPNLEEHPVEEEKEEPVEEAKNEDSDSDDREF